MKITIETSDSGVTITTESNGTSITLEVSNTGAVSIKPAAGVAPTKAAK